MSIPARRESETDAGLEARGCDDEVRRSFGQETRTEDVDLLALTSSMHPTLVEFPAFRATSIAFPVRWPITGEESRIPRARPTLFPTPSISNTYGRAFSLYASTGHVVRLYRSLLRTIRKAWKGMMYGNGAMRIDAQFCSKRSVKLVVAKQLVDMLTVSVLSVDPIASDPA
ncbi:hypothetical protein B0H19DRAFT_1268299 [Mycena capillaripes]|nr:hypothetical protein B0H19DRAFT_1268299 [Mycena capillaripes]